MIYWMIIIWAFCFFVPNWFALILGLYLGFIYQRFVHKMMNKPRRILAIWSWFTVIVIVSISLFITNNSNSLYY